MFQDYHDVEGVMVRRIWSILKGRLLFPETDCGQSVMYGMKLIEAGRCYAGY